MCGWIPLSGVGWQNVDYPEYYCLAPAWMTGTVCGWMAPEWFRVTERWLSRKLLISPCMDDWNCVLMNEWPLSGFGWQNVQFSEYVYSSAPVWITGAVCGWMKLCVDEWNCVWMNGTVCGWMELYVDDWNCVWMTGPVWGWMAPEWFRMTERSLSLTLRYSLSTQEVYHHSSPTLHSFPSNVLSCSR